MVYGWVGSGPAVAAGRFCQVCLCCPARCRMLVVLVVLGNGSANPPLYFAVRMLWWLPRPISCITVARGHGDPLGPCCIAGRVGRTCGGIARDGAQPKWDPIGGAEQMQRSGADPYLTSRARTRKAPVPGEGFPLPMNQAVGITAGLAPWIHP